jgi:hypothetical protein
MDTGTLDAVTPVSGVPVACRGRPPPGWVEGGVPDELPELVSVLPPPGGVPMPDPPVPPLPGGVITGCPPLVSDPPELDPLPLSSGGPPEPPFDPPEEVPEQTTLPDTDAVPPRLRLIGRTVAPAPRFTATMD